MKKIILLLLLFIFGTFYFSGCKYLFDEKKAKELISPALISISTYIKENKKFPIDLNQIKNFPYKDLEKKHYESKCNTCFFYPLFNSSYDGYVYIETSNREKSKFYFRVLFNDVKIGIRSCDYFFDLNGFYNGKCYKASGFGVNR